MKKPWVIILLVSAFFLTLPGLAGASSVPADATYNFYNAPGPANPDADHPTLGATVHATWSLADGLYTYQYQVTWVHFNPLNNLNPDGTEEMDVIAGVKIPVLQPVHDYGFVDDGGLGTAMLFNDGEQDFVWFILPEVLDSDNMLSPTMEIVSEFAPSIGIGSIHDGGESISDCLTAGITTNGGGNGEVPEPGALFLLGAAMLGLAGGVRRRINKKQ